MFLCLICKAEEAEEDEGADNAQPSRHLERRLGNGVVPPKHSRDLVDTGESSVSVLPTDPRIDLAISGIEVSSIYAEGNGAEDVSASESHETEVATGSEVGVAGKHLFGLGTRLVESTDTEDAINTRHKTNANGRSRDEQVGDPSVVCKRPTSDILVDVKSVTLRNVFYVPVSGYV